ncbi:class IV adenylate cyclase [Senegalia massiliensis]|uniref:CYTH domain-containing protein n=1 Tax=Senegalia massiliensis TaxID=1720316 RepID=A0A845QZP5_9CLOT|nr:class IV adenylate cyclase [Senegalia massiliensis]NBI05833.1 CYTH domain-containing protein [Senegalia massiliensis]
MTKELEVKVLGIDKEKIINKLEKIGAKKIKDEKQKNIILDTKDKRVENDYNGYLRIRTTKQNINNNCVEKVTLKTILSDKEYRENKEIEVRIDNSENMFKIFEMLGLVTSYIGYKERISYEFKGILFEIDTWDKDTYPETYMEIEIKNKKDLDRAIELLELDKSQITTKSITELRRDAGLE